MHRSPSHSRSQRIGAGVLLALLILVGASAVLLAQGGYGLGFISVDNGGGRVDASGYGLTAAMGQPDAGQVVAGAYTLTGGVLAAGGGGGPILVGDLKVFLPINAK